MSPLTQGLSYRAACDEETACHIALHEVIITMAVYTVCVSVLDVYNCQETEFGCCTDGLTAAAGPDGAGCPSGTSPLCQRTLYGCCPDGETPANGPDLTGCDVIHHASSTASAPCTR